MAEDTTSVDSKAGIVPVSPRRGHPQRVRKPNPRVFGDYEDYTITRPTSRSRKPFSVQKMAYAYKSPERMAAMPTPLPVPTYVPSGKSKGRSVLSTPDKKAAQGIGVRLRNLLKLPKAYKWVCNEWFYSNIDEILFEGENDFCICLKESFPQLKTRKLTRVEWAKIRRLMGKPRRCSPAFFEEERAALQKKREKIRMLQQRKVDSITDWKDLPDEIPIPLVIGTKVTARLRKPQDGLFTGRIDALDSVNHTYRVTFDRPALGTHSIPDIEVLSHEPQETIPLTAFQPKRQPRSSNPLFLSPPRGLLPGQTSPGLVSENDPLLGSSPLRTSLASLEDGTYGGFPVKFLVLVTRLSKILSMKKDRVKILSEMNTEAEKMRSHGQSFPSHFQQQYAAMVLELETLNKELNEHWIGVQQYAQEIAPDQGIPALDQPSEIMKKCIEDAHVMVRKHNVVDNGEPMIKNEKTTDLVGKLTGLLLQIKTFSENEMHCFEFKSLQDALADIRQSLHPSNLDAFQNNVEIHVNHIQSGLSQMGNLHAFAASQT